MCKCQMSIVCQRIVQILSFIQPTAKYKSQLSSRDHVKFKLLFPEVWFQGKTTKKNENYEDYGEFEFEMECITLTSVEIVC